MVARSHLCTEKNSDRLITSGMPLRLEASPEKRHRFALDIAELRNVIVKINTFPSVPKSYSL